MNSCMKLYKQFSDPANALCHNGLKMGKNSPQVSISIPKRQKSNIL